MTAVRLCKCTTYSASKGQFSPILLGPTVSVRQSGSGNLGQGPDPTRGELLPLVAPRSRTVWSITSQHLSGAGTSASHSSSRTLAPGSFYRSPEPCSVSAPQRAVTQLGLAIRSAFLRPLRISGMPSRLGQINLAPTSQHLLPLAL